MIGPMRVVLASSGAAEFALLHEVCESAGHSPVAYAYSRSMRPGQDADAYAVRTVGELLGTLPARMDLLLPGDPAGLATAIAGYAPDLLVIYGFNWILPPAVFQLPTCGAINIHPSLLPKYRGPAPVPCAIRDGDPEIGVTVHRIDEGVDTGPILAQQGGIPLDDDVTPDSLRAELLPAVREVLATALARVADGDPGREQAAAGASRAPMLEPQFALVDWSRTAREIHNQVRVYRYIRSPDAPVARVGDGWLRLVRTSLTPADGVRVDCADGPLWIVESEPVAEPVTEPPPAGQAAPAE